MLQLSTDRSAHKLYAEASHADKEHSEIDIKNFSENFDQSTQNSEPLSWKFLEQVSSLDNQLRSEHSAQGNHIDIKAINSEHDSHQLAATAISNTKKVSQHLSNNGNALTDDGLLNVEILSQQITAAAAVAVEAAVEADAAALNAQFVQQTQTNFQFTTPTSTFRRKKQQQAEHQQQQQQQQQLAQLSSAKASITWQQPSSQQAALANNATSQQQQQQQQQQQEEQRATMLNSSGGNADSSKFVGTTTARTLPAISRQQREGATPKEQRKANKVGLMVSSNNNGSGSGRAATRGNGSGGSGGGGGGGAGGASVSSAAVPQRATLDRRPRNAPAMTQSTGIVVCGSSSAAAAAVGAGQLDGGGLVDGIETYLGLIGWRKKCLYTLLLLLMLLIVTNLVLTLWILKVMEFTTDGMGQLKIVPGGIQLTGQAIIMDMLRASTIRSRHGQPIAIESSRNFSINTRDPNGLLENHLFLGHDKFECLSAGFHINDTNGRNLFSVNRNEVTVGAHALRIDGEGGAIFRESIQTPHIRAEPGRELRLESPTRQMELTAAKDINLQSRAGGIELLALEDVKLRALDGSLRFESSKILMPNLRTAQPPLMGSQQSRDHLHRVFQLCACSNGKLFLAAPHSICAGDDSTVCR